MLINQMGRSWEWPDSDVECRRVVFDWSKDLDIALHYCKQYRTAIQAGGNMGVWPWLLSKHFDFVVTAEPEAECFKCLQKNVPQENVLKINAAFGRTEGTCSMAFDKRGRANMGAQFMVAGDECRVITIDGLQITDCDLIYLDVEGAELLALQGAVETIVSSKPVIVVEDKGLSEKFGSKRGDIERWLGAEFGYKVVARPHRDVVLVC